MTTLPVTSRLDEPGPRSALALLSLILGVIPLTAAVGVVLSIIAFFRMSVSQHRAQRHAGIGFVVGFAWLIVLGLTALAIFAR